MQTTTIRQTSAKAMTIYLGIDPGVSEGELGAVAAVDLECRPLAAFNLPIDRPQNELPKLAYNGLIAALRDNDLLDHVVGGDFHALIEEPNYQGKRMAFIDKKGIKRPVPVSMKLAYNAGELRMFFRGLASGDDRIATMNAAVWHQKAYGGKGRMDRDNAKQTINKYNERIFQKRAAIATNQGQRDALAMAELCWRLNRRNMSIRPRVIAEKIGGK